MWTPLTVSLVIIAISIVEAFLITGVIGVYFKERARQTAAPMEALKALMQKLENAKAATDKKEE